MGTRYFIHIALLAALALAVKENLSQYSTSNMQSASDMIVHKRCMEDFEYAVSN